MAAIEINYETFSNEHHARCLWTAFALAASRTTPFRESFKHRISPFASKGGGSHISTVAHQKRRQRPEPKQQQTKATTKTTVDHFGGFITDAVRRHCFEIVKTLMIDLHAAHRNLLQNTNYGKQPRNRRSKVK